MADSSVNHLFELINQHIDYQGNLSDCLSQAEALVSVAVSHNFYDYSDELKHHYMGALGDIIDKAKVINQKVMNHLFEIKSAIAHFTTPID